MDLTQEQRDVAHAILADLSAGKPKVSLSGLAGVGKTTVAQYILDHLDERWACVAPTGKAADVLRRKGAHNACTIHSLIYKPYQDAKGKVKFRRVDHLDGVDGIVCDEASMVGEPLYRDLMAFRVPVLFLGDHGQLPPVDRGSSNFSLVEHTDYRLETIHRNAGDIVRFAHLLRAGEWDAVKAWRDSEDVQIMSRRGLDPALLLQADQIICAFNKTRVGINRTVRSMRGLGETLQPGDRVMCLRNNRDMGLFNGMQGIVLEHWSEPSPNPRQPADCYLTFRNDDGRIIEAVSYDPEQFHQPGYDRNGSRPEDPNPFDYAYCATAHKCVAPDTMVDTDHGYMPIDEVASTGTIWTPDGTMRPYDSKVSRPDSPMRRVVTTGGYDLSMTTDHGIDSWTASAGYVRREAGGLAIGDWLRLRPGHGVDIGAALLPPRPQGDVRAVLHDVPSAVNPDVAELLGLMVGDGTVWRKGFRLVKRHPEVVERFDELCRSIFGVKVRRFLHTGTPAAEVNSAIIAEWMRTVGGLGPNAKAVPSAIFRSTLTSQAAFLRGLFEDGGVNIRGQTVDHVELWSAYPKMISDVRRLLLRQGIVTGQTSHPRQQGYGNVMIYHPLDALRLFGQRIGFISKEKQRRVQLAAQHTPSVCRDQIPLSHEQVAKGVLSKTDYQNLRTRGYTSRSKLQEWSRRGACSAEATAALAFIHQRVRSIDDYHGPSVCVRVPQGHRFVQGGFSGWNCQGSEADTVLVLYEEYAIRTFGKFEVERWAYTAATRAKKRLVWAV